jgi:hypothetical protein
MGRWKRNVIRGERELGTLATKGVINYNCWSWLRFFCFFFWFFVFLSAFAFALVLSLGGAKLTGGWPAEGDDQKHCWLSVSDVLIGILIRPERIS